MHLRRIIQQFWMTKMILRDWTNHLCQCPTRTSFTHRMASRLLNVSVRKPIPKIPSCPFWINALTCLHRERRRSANATLFKGHIQTAVPKQFLYPLQSGLSIRRSSDRRWPSPDERKSSFQGSAMMTAVVPLTSTWDIWDPAKSCDERYCPSCLQTHDPCTGDGTVQTVCTTLPSIRRTSPAGLMELVPKF